MNGRKLLTALCCLILELLHIVCFHHILHPSACLMLFALISWTKIFKFILIWRKKSYFFLSELDVWLKKPAKSLLHKWSTRNRWEWKEFSRADREAENKIVKDHVTDVEVEATWSSSKSWDLVHKQEVATFRDITARGPMRKLKCQRDDVVAGAGLQFEVSY